MSLVLKGVDYGPVQSASGAQGWFGEGYWYHKWVPGLRWNGCTFVSKTTTLNARVGNMPLNDKGQARELFPKCVIVKPWKGVVLNSVGLSGPGAEFLLSTGNWQKLDRPFFLSFMSVAADKLERLQEAQVFADLLQRHASEFQSPFGLQVNLSCPNTGHDPSEIAKEAREILEVFQILREDEGIPIVPKFNVLFPVRSVFDLQDLCDAVCISNTLPWGTTPPGSMIPWNTLFQSSHSPLKHLGGGGLSGKPLLPLVYKWVKEARAGGVVCPINAGGGILGPKDVNVLAEAGADSVFLGSIAILRGWRLRKTIKRACEVLR